MKKLVYILITLVPILVFSQSINQNYVKSTTYKIPSTTTLPNSPPSQQASVDITYFDGIGRPKQQIAHKQSASGKDIITHIEYDYLGRQAKEYLPFPSTQNNMAYFSDIETLKNELENYHQDVPFSEKLFEPSPLNRIKKQGFTGTDWQITQNNNDHTIKFDYQTNRAREVILFKVNITNTTDGVYNPTLVQDGYYPANKLYKTTITNENGTQTTEFKDSEGRIILKRIHKDITSLHEARPEVFDTYYVYDIYGNLTYVIPPKASITTINNSVLDDLCYQYKYDHRNHLVEKKIPGKTTEYIVYDKLDRIVASGPTLCPFQYSSELGWLVTKYDVLGRIAYTGWYKSNSFSSSARNAMQTQVNAGNIHVIRGTQTKESFQIGYSNNGTYPEITNILTINYYDNYSHPYALDVIPTTIEQQNVTQNTKGLLTGSWVRVLTIKQEKLYEMTHTFYDNKARPIHINYRNHYGGYTKTDTKLDFIGTPQYVITKHKLTDNDNEITIREDFQYTPQGLLLSHKHKINNMNYETLSHNKYDELGQLIEQKVGKNADNPLQTVNYKYNIRGWLTDINDVNNLGDNLFAFKINYNTVEHSVWNLVKPLYNGNISETFWKTSTDNVLRKYDYGYDFTDRLLNAYFHKVDSNNQAIYTDSYNEHIRYDKNGNITKLLRYGDLDSDLEYITIDDLEYFYDQGNKLKKVTDKSNHPAGFNDEADNENEYGYNDFGNIIRDDNKKMWVYYNHLNLPDIVLREGATKMILYTYNALGEKLNREVKETNPKKTTTTDYQGIFHYQNKKLQFLATAQGYVDKKEGIPTDLDPLPHPIVEIPFSENSENKPSLSFFNYVYNYTDHLGNIRLSYTESNRPTFNSVRVLEENHYYPFGLKHQKYGSVSKDFVVLNEEDGSGYYVGIEPVTSQKQQKKYQYKFQGQELQTEFGLDFYDFGARIYEPTLGRWYSIDPLAEQSRRWSPYNFAYNNPFTSSTQTECQP